MLRAHKVEGARALLLLELLPRLHLAALPLLLLCLALRVARSELVDHKVDEEEEDGAQPEVE